MKIVYRTNESIEADSVVDKLSEQGITAKCSRKEEFNAVTGTGSFLFEISVEDSLAEKAKELLNKQRGETSWKSFGNASRKKRVVAWICLVVCLLFLLAAFVAGIAGTAG